MTKSIEYEDFEHAFYRVRGEFIHFGSEDRPDNFGGIVRTPFGFVDVVTWQNNATMLSFIWQGRDYHRTYQKPLTKKGAITKAVRFAREIVRCH